MPRVEQAERTSQFPLELMPKMGAAGFLGLPFPEATAARAATCWPSRSSARSWPGPRAASPSRRWSAPTWPRRTWPTTARRSSSERYLRPIIAGAKSPPSPSPSRAPAPTSPACRTVARADEGGYRINGTQDVHHQRRLRRLHRRSAPRPIPTEPATAASRCSSSRRTTPASRSAAPLQKMGWHSSDTRELIFDDCLRARGARPRRELAAASTRSSTSFQTERITLAGMGVGLAQAALDDALDYAKRPRGLRQRDRQVPVDPPPARRHGDRPRGGPRC